MVCSKGLRYSKRKRFGRWNSKVPVDVFLRGGLAVGRRGHHLREFGAAGLGVCG
jgi:hypothetical protein